MYKLCIALGWSVIRMQLKKLFEVEDAELWSRIKQHRIIMSDKLDSYYSEKAKEEGLLDDYRCFIQNYTINDTCIEISDVFDDINRNIANFIKNKSKSISLIISDNDEFHISKSSCRYQYTVEQAVDDEDGPFAIYSYKAIFHVKEETSARDYLMWIKNLMSNEKEVNIIDQYVLADLRNYKSFINNILPLVPKGCKLNLHVLSSAIYIPDFIEHSCNLGYDVAIYEYYQMHDRYITTSDRIITIGLGVDFMREKEHRLEFREGSHFSLSKKKTNGEYLAKEKDLAGRFKGEVDVEGFLKKQK